MVAFRRGLLLLFLTTLPLSTAAPYWPTVIESELLRAPFALEIPEISSSLITAPDVVIPSLALTTIRLRVFPPFAEQIDFGKIHTTVNGEASDTIASKLTGSSGHIVELDLKEKPRFRLQPDKNVIEISATDRSDKTWYASFVLHSGKRPVDDMTSNAIGATIESFPAAANLSKANADLTPPVIYLTNPASTVFLSSSSLSLVVSGDVSDDSGKVTAVTVNGLLAELTKANPRSLAVELGITSGIFRFEQTVIITAKTLFIVVEAKDQSGNLTRISIPVRQREAPNAERFTGRKFALVIGISRYRYHERGLEDLEYADADSHAIRDYLQEPEGGNFAPSDILYLENEQATLDATRAALRRFLPLAKTDDLMFIFLASHGGPDPFASQNLYFFLHDSRLSDMARTALPMSELREALQYNLIARRVIVFVDSCHSAGLNGQQFLARGMKSATENNLVNLYAARLFKETGRAIITSSDISEKSWENSYWGGGHGVFTWSLLEGLKGEADTDADRFITAGELFSYVTNRVRLETGGIQNPRTYIGNNTNLTLAAVKKR
jgi:hypothetical protein